MKPLVSVYGTVYNNARTVVSCVLSIQRVMNTIGVPWEIVVTDNYSTDGTYEILSKLMKTFPIKVIRKRCSRGKGRNLALRLSSGYYVMYIDFDMELKSYASKLIEYYIENADDYTVYMPFGFTTRISALRIGGWRDLNHGEDTEFFARAAVRARLVRVLVPTPRHEEWTQGSRRCRYVKERLLYLKRLVKDRLDSFRACAPSYFQFKEIYLRNTPSTLGKVLKLLLYLAARTRGLYKYCNFLRNNELVLLKARFLFPEDVGLDRDMLFFKYNLRVLDRNGFKVFIKRLTNILAEAYERGYDKLLLLCSCRSGYMYLVKNLSRDVSEEIAFTEHHSKDLTSSLQSKHSSIVIAELILSK